MKQDPPAPWVLVGKIGKPIGMDGSVRVCPEAELGEIFEKRVPLALWAPSQAPETPLESERFRQDGKGWVVKWRGWEERETVANLTNRWIVARRDDLPDPQEGHAYWCDLVGALVETKEGVCLGTVRDVFETPAQTVVEVASPSGGEFLVPLTEEVDADLRSPQKAGEPNRLVVSLPPGMQEATGTQEDGPKKEGRKRRPRARRA